MPKHILTHDPLSVASFAEQFEVNTKSLVIDYEKVFSNPQQYLSDKNITLWSKQREIIQSLVDNPRTCVKSCHSSGKTFTVSIGVDFWLESHPPCSAFVVTLAPTFSQVRSILWREISRHASRELYSKVNQTELHMINPSNGREQLVAIGRSPQDMGSLQGIHAENLLIIYDEGQGIQDWIYDVGETLISGSKKFRMLAIGNPDIVGNKYHKLFSLDTWHEISIPCDSTPNFTGEEVPEHVSANLIKPEWAEEMREQWIPSMIRSKLDAEFPLESSDSFFPYDKLIAAQLRDATETDSPRVLGVDVGGGGDFSSWALREGEKVRIVDKDQEPDLTKTADKTVVLATSHDVDAVVIDADGLGQGVYNMISRTFHLQGLSSKITLIPFKASRKKSVPSEYENSKAHCYDIFRQALIRTAVDLDPKDLELLSQAASIQAFTNKSGKLQIEDKAKTKGKIKGRSPDELESVLMSFYYGQNVKGRKKARARGSYS